MTKPIGQTFFINEPVGGAEGVVLTKVDVYFQSVSKTYGVEVQIRTTENGVPTPYRLPNASKVLQVSDTYASGATWTTNNAVIATSTPIIAASADGQTPTTFEFDTPIFLQSQTSYALMIIPVGGNPDYNVWVGELNKNDIVSKTPINTNNDTGTLFLSSNDIQFTSIIGEDIKFSLHIADFSISGGTGTATIVPFDEENITFNSLSGGFAGNEFIYVGNGNLNLVLANISANTAAFTIGERVYQSNGTVNVAQGNVVFANTSVIKVANTKGAFINSGSYPIQGTLSGANATIAAINANVISYSNTLLTVPFTANGTANIFYANQSLYVGSNTRSEMVPVIVNNVINSTAIYLKTITPLDFTDSDCILGQIRGDALTLYGRYSGPTAESISLLRDNDINAFLWGSSANSTQNFYGTTNQYLIGSQSRASAIMSAFGGTKNLPYTAIVPQFATNNSKSTNIDFSFTGFDQLNYVADSANTQIINHVSRELTDKLRSFKSRSNEYVEDNGNYTTKLFATLSTANNKFTPYIDRIQRYTTFTYNFIGTESILTGFLLKIKNTFGVFKTGQNTGDIVQQINSTGIINLVISSNTGAFSASETIYQRDATGANTATGTLWFANSSLIQVVNSTGLWNNSFQIKGDTSTSNATVTTAGSTTVTGKVVAANTTHLWVGNVSGGKFKGGYDLNVVGTPTINTTVTSSRYYSERFNGTNTFTGFSRYISKSVILADKQDAEDLICYLTAYRPAGSNFLVYGKFLHSQDPESFADKYWSKLTETSSPALISSSSNPDDFVELVYSLPTSAVLLTNSVTCNTTSANVTVETTAGINDGNYIYLNNSSTNTFIVRQVFAVANNTTLVLTDIPSFNSSNADLGKIPGLAGLTGAFHNDLNNNIIRYVSNTDVVYDNYKTFAVKIVPVADFQYIVPRAADMRCLALQV